MYNLPMDDNSTNFPILETERLILRQLTEADAQGLFEIYTDPAVTRFIDIPELAEPAQAARLISEHEALRSAGKGLRWGVFEVETGQLIGTCGYHDWTQDKFRAEISYDLGSRHWGNGFMREALQAAVHYGFAGLKLHRIEALVDPEDTRSQNLLFGLGFKLEGVLHEHDYIGGKFEDDMVFAMIQPDWLRSH